MRKLGDVRRDVKNAYKRLKSWRAVGAEMGISGGMAYRIAKDQYEPKDAHIRAMLGMSAMMPAPACPVCGVVHVARQCPMAAIETKRAKRRLFDLPVGELRKMLDEREEW